MIWIAPNHRSKECPCNFLISEVTRIFSTSSRMPTLLSSATHLLWPISSFRQQPVLSRVRWGPYSNACSGKKHLTQYLILQLLSYLVVLSQEIFYCMPEVLEASPAIERCWRVAYMKAEKDWFYHSIHQFYSEHYVVATAKAARIYSTKFNVNPMLAAGDHPTTLDGKYSKALQSIAGHNIAMHLKPLDRFFWQNNPTLSWGKPLYFLHGEMAMKANEVIRLVWEHSKSVFFWCRWKSIFSYIQLICSDWLTLFSLLNLWSKQIMYNKFTSVVFRCDPMALGYLRSVKSLVSFPVAFGQRQRSTMGHGGKRKLLTFLTKAGTGGE